MKSLRDEIRLRRDKRTFDVFFLFTIPAVCDIL